MRVAMEDNFSVNKLSNISNEFNDYFTNEKTFTTQNIRQAMTTLLQVEDMITLRDYADLVQRNANFHKFKNRRFFRMKARMNVPKGIIIEDKVFPFDEVMFIPEIEQTTAMQHEPSMDLILRSTDDGMKKKNGRKGKRTTIFYGLIKRVSNRTITFESKTKVSEDISYIIIFRPSRFTLRYQYRALELLDTMPSTLIKRFLFPEKSFAGFLPCTRLNLQNKSIVDNPEQLQAVQIIVDETIKTAPYIIFGPPGTGKTTTIVEAILQLYLRRSSTKILVTAGSNSACNEIALRLCKVLSKLNDLRAITRIYSRSYEKRLDNTDELLLEYSNFYSAHFYPEIDLLHEYRIVVCTLNTVGKIILGNFGKTKDGIGVYTHVFVDEAAASTEAETLVGIAGILTSKSNLIISGDHKQLGPILSSERAAELGLDVSLMERLLKRDCYAVDKCGNYDRSIQTRLCQNHRSHPEIVNLYNRLYYNNELKAMVTEDVKSLCEKWHRSPSATYPIIFHSTFGTAGREGKSQSWYNQREVEVVMDYVKDLMYFGVNGQKITQDDIGIISPYKKQYERIQEELNLRKWYKIETGSVEIFQGKEKTIIIVCFVRSFTNTLGFLESPRRLNVTLSRPKSFLILIGNPKTLSLNADFKHIINECHRNNTLVGAAYHEHSKDTTTNEKKSKNNTNNKGSNVTKSEPAKGRTQPQRQQLGRNKKNREQGTGSKQNSIPRSNVSKPISNELQSAIKSRSRNVNTRQSSNSHGMNSVEENIDSLQKLLNSAYIARDVYNLSTQSARQYQTRPIINSPLQDNSLHTSTTPPQRTKKSSWKCIIS